MSSSELGTFAALGDEIPREQDSAIEQAIRVASSIPLFSQRCVFLITATETLANPPIVTVDCRDADSWLADGIRWRSCLRKPRVWVSKRQREFAHVLDLLYA